MREIRYKYFRDGKWHIWEVNSGFNDNCYYHALHSSSAMLQYTGRRDKNGVEIYEGDVVVCPGLTEEGAVVKWWDSDLTWSVVGTGESFSEFYEDWKDKLEIIGNIYENPELL